MTIKYKEQIEVWDKRDCAQHVANLVNNINNILKERNIKEYYYIDIGANVGKVYDMLSSLAPVKRVWMYEASPLLYNYMVDKYRDDNAVVLNNLAISDHEGILQFDESSMLHQIQHNINHTTQYNFGLSQLRTTDVSVPVTSTKISNIIKTNSEIFNKVSFIKIDTESVDFKILEDLVTVVNLFKIKPVIEFERNYNHCGYSDQKAQLILNLFVEVGYRPLHLEECQGDGILLPV